ncbi:hypothetical protein MGYG_01659 [Nannizzia gypsea CBS 118893]|uniref:Aminoglycoside phosphotransferase domain-containing protein n=1 Tax=Arthroderma gypseum (strain ATCC MYA-4604 / CBS 118893) TaxID=535722 RepID=E5R273_ARTGP|nr:hypothetical protein MGYG_01659 [Nannizzia gypsea CBS 118893]EFQ98637.1 hypothetical protein MGYG_01659 [Nannizzia gypsea CBS 118893]
MVGFSLLPCFLMPDFTWPNRISRTVASEIPETPRASHPKVLFSEYYCRWVGATFDNQIAQLPFGLILKWSDGTRLEEVLTMEAARRAGLPVPKVICYGDRPDTPHAPISILMTRIPGDELGRVYKTLTDTERGSIQLQLKGYLETIRRWKSPWGENRICSLVGTAIRSVRVPNHLVAPPSRNKSSTNTSGALLGQADSHQKRNTTTHLIVPEKWIRCLIVLFSHTVTLSFLDWESAGWYPEYWDFTTALRFIPKDYWWYSFVIGLGGGPYMAELDFERALTSLTVDSYCW